MQRKPPPLEKIQASRHSPEHPILTKVKTMKRPNCPWTDERIRKTCSREDNEKTFLSNMDGRKGSTYIR